jgi:hypothetical protein
MINAINGSIISCESKPIISGLGNKNSFLKLSIVSDKPTPSIMKARVRLNNMSINEYEEEAMRNLYNQRESKNFRFPPVYQNLKIMHYNKARRT